MKTSSRFFAASLAVLFFALPVVHGAPVAYWSFDQDFTATVGGSAFDGTAVNGVSIDSSQSRFGGGSARFDRALSQYIRVEASPFTQGSYTYAAWYYLDVAAIAGSARYFVLEATNAAVGTYPASYGLRALSGVQAGQVFTHDNTANVAANHSRAFPSGPHQQWQHIAVTFDAVSRQFTIYLNGVDLGIHFPLPGTTLSVSDFLIIGGHRAGTGRNWQGWIDDVGVWDRVLSPAEIAALQTSPIVDVPPGEAALIVSSAAPGTSPEHGIYTYPLGTELTLTAPAETVSPEGFRYRLLGWRATGSAPAQGEGGTMTFTLNQSTTVEWLWRQVSGPIAPIVGWDFRGNPTAAPVELAPRTMAEGVTAVPLTRGDGLLPADVNEAFGANRWGYDPVTDAWQGASRENAIATNEFYQFGFTVEEGRRAYVSTLDASFRRSAFNAPLYLEWQYSLDGFATPGTPIVPAGEAWERIGWMPDSFVRHGENEFHWSGATFLYRGRSVEGTPDHAVAVDYNYMTRDVTFQGAVRQPGNPMPTIDLSGIAELQGIPGNTTVTFRLYAWGNESTTLTNHVALGRQDGPAVGGAVVAEGELPLTLVSSRPGTEPAAGIHAYPAGAEVTLTAPAVDEEADGVRHALAGWRGAGAAPAAGSGTSATFTMNDAARFEWDWQTLHRMAVGAEGAGTVEVRHAAPELLLGFDFGPCTRAEQTDSGVAAATVAPGVGPSTLTRGPGLTGEHVDIGGLSSSNWLGAANLASAVAQGNYLEFNVTPAGGAGLELTAIYLPYRYTQTGPHSIALVYSVDNFATYTEVESVEIQDQASGSQVDRRVFVLFDEPLLRNITSEVRFRIYGWGAGGTGTGGHFGPYNERGIFQDDMIVFGGSSGDATVSGPGQQSLWLEVESLASAVAEPAGASNMFTGWSGDFFHSVPRLGNLDMRRPLALTGHFATDSDGDGIPDAWKLQYFGHLSVGAGDDPDGDGFTNFEEHVRGTDPTVADDALAVDVIPFARWENPQRDPILPGGWIYRDFGMGFRGAWEGSNNNRSALTPFHSDREEVQPVWWVSFDGPRIVVREEHWEEAWGDGTFETVFSVGDDDGTALYFRYVDELNWYRVVIAGELNTAASRPQYGVGVQKRVGGQYHDLFVHNSGLGTDPADVTAWKRIRIRATLNGSHVQIVAAGWEVSLNDWAGPGAFGHVVIDFNDPDAAPEGPLGRGRAGIGTWAQGGAPGGTVMPDWNPVSAGTLFESFVVEHGGQAVFTEDWLDLPEPDELPAGWENPLAGIPALAGVWRHSAHGTLVEMSSQGQATTGTTEGFAVDGDGPILLAPEVEAEVYLLEIGLHTFNSGGAGFVYDYVDANNYGRVLFVNRPGLETGGMPTGVTVARKQNGLWSAVFLADTTFVPTLGRPHVATFSRAGQRYTMTVQEADRPEPLHRWQWEEASVPAGSGRHGLATWQTSNAHFLFADMYGAVAAGGDPGLRVTAIERVGETIVLTVENMSGQPYRVERAPEVSGPWETVETGQTAAMWSGPIPAGADRSFWRLTR